jgi:hypothetical protein
VTGTGTTFGGLGSGFYDLANAKGNLFDGGNVIPFARGGIPSIVNTPTFFPMADGETGLMGEAGPEAIMPLKRDKGGELAVTMVGERGQVQLLPVTRDRSGRMAVKAFAAGGVIERDVPRNVSNVIPFARGGVFGGSMPARRFASGTVVMPRPANSSALSSDLRNNVVPNVAANAGGDTYYLQVTQPPGASRESGTQFGGAMTRELRRSGRNS